MLLIATGMRHIQMMVGDEIKGECRRDATKWLMVMIDG